MVQPLMVISKKPISYIDLYITAVLLEPGDNWKQQLAAEQSANGGGGGEGDGGGGGRLVQNAILPLGGGQPLLSHTPRPLRRVPCALCVYPYRILCCVKTPLPSLDNLLLIGRSVRARFILYTS